MVTLIAGGNSGHVCAGLIDGNTQGRVKVQLLTSRPELFRSLRPKAGRAYRPCVPQSRPRAYRGLGSRTYRV